MNRLSVIGHARIQRAQKNLVGGGIADSSGDRDSVFDHRDGNAELGNTCNKFSRAVQRINDPYSLFLETRQVVYAFFREPAFAFAQQFAGAARVNCFVGFGDRIVARFVFGFDLAGRETGEDLAGCIQRGLDSLQVSA